jgi:DNA-binding NarL/FixJ family response regulator
VSQVRVGVQAPDPLSHAGLVRLLQSRREIVLRHGDRPDGIDVLVVCCERPTNDVVGRLRRTAAEAGVPIVLITEEIAESELLTVVGCRVVAILPRESVTADRVVHSVLAAAAGGGVMPPSLVGELLKHIERLQRDVLAPNGLNASGLDDRELDVLRLMADGFDTAEIAQRLSYSERTVKNVIQGVTRRLGLRSRSHAVAHVLRAGVI